MIQPLTELSCFELQVVAQEPEQPFAGAGRERVGEHSRCRILTLFHEFLDVSEARIVLGEMILLAG